MMLQGRIKMAYNGWRLGDVVDFQHKHDSSASYRHFFQLAVMHVYLLLFISSLLKARSSTNTGLDPSAGIKDIVDIAIL